MSASFGNRVGTNSSFLFSRQVLAGCLAVCAAFVALNSRSAHAGLVLRESFDIPAGSLDGQAGATSFGFLPGTLWDSGIFGPPNVVAGSISVPVSVAGFYNVTPAGNRYSTNAGTVIGRGYSRSGPHFFGSFLTTTSLDPTLATDALYGFQNFSFRAVNAGSGSFWRMDSFGFINTGVNADGTTLVMWELEFNQSGAADTFRIWFNRNPLTDNPDFESTTVNLGFNNLGGGGNLHFHSNLYLGLSSLQIDELRIGTDWASVGVLAIPEPNMLILTMGLMALAMSLSDRRGARRHTVAG